MNFFHYFQMNDMKYTTECDMIQTSINSIEWDSMEHIFEANNCKPFHRDSQQYFNAMEVVMKASMRSGALSDSSWVKAVPLYSWFCSSRKLLPNETLHSFKYNREVEIFDGLFGSSLVEETWVYNITILNTHHEQLIN